MSNPDPGAGMLSPLARGGDHLGRALNLSSASASSEDVRDPIPATAEAIAFLLQYCKSEPIVLTAIIPNGGSIESETFRPAKEQERLRDWIDARQGSRNLYFTVNPTTKVFSGKVRPKKEDMMGMTTLHVDIDPRAGEDLERERNRAFRVLKQFSPPPSVIIDFRRWVPGLLDTRPPLRNEWQRGRSGGARTLQSAARDPSPGRRLS